MNEKLTDLYRKLSLITHTIESAEDCYVNFQILEETINAKMKITEISNVSLNTFKFACLYQAIMNLSKVFADKNRSSYTISKLFDEFVKYKNEFYNSNLVENTISDLKNRLNEYDESISRLKQRRNKMYAHNDKEYFGDKDKIVRELPLFFADKECLIDYGKFATNKLKELFNRPGQRISHYLYGNNQDFHNTIEFIENNYKKLN